MRLGQFLRVPLHREDPGAAGRLDGLGQAVGRRPRNRETRRDRLDRLVVPAVDPDLGGRRERREPARRTGSSSWRRYAQAEQKRCTGHVPHRGWVGRQMVLPSSISPCVKSAALPSGTMARAHWQAIRPTPPAAAWNNTWSPAAKPPWGCVFFSRYWAVSPFSIIAAPVSKSMASGSLHTVLAGITRNSL